jgi:DNA-binding NarL/FixJ family response regulator
LLKSILIVDDSALIRRLVKLFFDSHTGFAVCGEAADGAEGVEKAQELKPDLVILDLAMPRMNGLETAAALRKTMPGLPIILFTMHKDIVPAEEARDCGIASILSKTDSLDTLAQEAARLVTPGPLSKAATSSLPN